MTKQEDPAKHQKQTGQSFLKGTLILTIAGMVVKVIGSLNWIILSRVLGGEGIGLYQMAFPLYLLALQLSSAGLPVAISITTAEKMAKQDQHGANRVFRISLMLLAISGLALSLALFFGAHWLIDYRIIRDPRAFYSLIALSPAIFFVTILSSFRGYLQGCQLMTPTAVSQIAEQLFRVGAMLVFASLLLPYGLEYAAGGASLGAGAGAMAGLAVLVYYYYKLKRSQAPVCSIASASESGITIVRRLALLALPVSLSSILLPLVANIDLFIVPFRLEEAGYSVEQATELFGYLTGMAVPLVNLTTLFTAALATSIVPAISAASSVGDTNSVKIRISAAIRLTYLVSLPGAAILLLLAEPVTSLIYNAPAAAPAVEILSAAVFLLGLHQVTTGVLQGLGQTTIPVINMGLSALVKVALNWTLTAVPYLGIRGAAWATVTDIGLAALLNLFWIWRHCDFSFSTSTLVKALTATAAMAATLIISQDLLAYFLLGAIWKTGLSFLAGACVYIVSLLILGAINDQDLHRIPLAGAYLASLLVQLRIIKKQ